MLKRYKTNKDGSSKLLALVYTKEEHNIDKSLIDNDVLYVLKALHDSGEEAYIVGGAIRDLMCSTTPKDFDVATSAVPKKVKKIFTQSRIIGRRFQIVHVPFEDKIIEVSTFRSSEAIEGQNNNIFGTLLEDADRRDFTVNSLYYNPFTEQLLDFHGGFLDLHNNLLRPVIPMSTSFITDPVRMIRAIKYAIKCSLKIDTEIKASFYKHCSELTTVSESRLVEEFNKILLSGYCLEIFHALEKYELLLFIAPRISEEVMRNNIELFENLAELDGIIKSGQKIELGQAYGLLLSFMINKKEVEKLALNERYTYVLHLLRKALRPLSVPWTSLHSATNQILSKKNIDYFTLEKPEERVPASKAKNSIKEPRKAKTSTKEAKKSTSAEAKKSASAETKKSSSTVTKKPSSKKKKASQDNQ